MLVRWRMVADVPVTTGPGPGLGVRDADGRPRRESRTSSRVVEPGLGLFRRRAAVAIASSVSLWPDPNRFHAWGQERDWDVRVILLASKRLSVCLIRIRRWNFYCASDRIIRSSSWIIYSSSPIICPFNSRRISRDPRRDCKIFLLISLLLIIYFSSSSCFSMTMWKVTTNYSIITKGDHDFEEVGKYQSSL